MRGLGESSPWSLLGYAFELDDRDAAAEQLFQVMLRCSWRVNSMASYNSNCTNYILGSTLKGTPFQGSAWLAMVLVNRQLCVWSERIAVYSRQPTMSWALCCGRIHPQWWRPNKLSSVRSPVGGMWPARAIRGGITV